MNDKKITDALFRAVDSQTPDVLQRVLADVAVPQKTEETTMTNAGTDKTARGANKWRRYATLAACLALVIGLALTVYATRFAVSSSLTIDVNPSVEVQLNRRDRVIRANALNGDGAQILADMDLTDTDATVAVNAIIGSMVRNGYISEVQNAVLLTVNAGSAEAEKALLAALDDEIVKTLDAYKINPRVINQTSQSAATAEYETQPDSMGNSAGKQIFIDRVLKKYPELSAYDLTVMTITQITELIDELDDIAEDIIDDDYFDVVSIPADVETVSRAKALSIALADVGKAESEVNVLRCAIESDDGRLEYEIVFTTDGALYKYSYELDAITGQIIEREREQLVGYKYEDDDDRDDLDDDYDDLDDDDINRINSSAITSSAVSGSAVAPTEYISTQQAQDAAFAAAGVNQSDATVLRCRLDSDDGRPEYEVVFTTQNGMYKYSFELDAVTGDVIEFEREQLINGEYEDIEEYDSGRNDD